MTTEATELSFTGAIKTFFLAPFRLRTYSNLLYLMLAFPLGLAYFIFLAVGLPLGLGLTIIWIGIPVLALVFAGSWGLAGLERQSAIHLLRAQVPPRTRPPVQEEQGFWKKVYAFYTNPVTWKGMAFLLIKFPLGIVTFILLVTLLATTAAFLLAPFAVATVDYGWDSGWIDSGDDLNFGLDVWDWQVDTFPEAFICSAFGLVLLFVSLNLLNGLAFLWARTSEVLLGQRSFAATPQPPVLSEPLAV
ncbi:MAG TPA: sensor domain-containing protein [Thermoanaerobaculia bacterium]